MLVDSVTVPTHLFPRISYFSVIQAAYEADDRSQPRQSGDSTGRRQAAILTGMVARIRTDGFVEA
jgi:hypothetical protein